MYLYTLNTMGEINKRAGRLSEIGVQISLSL